MSDKEKLEKLIAEGEQLATNKVTRDLPEFTSWKTSVRRLLSKLFGEKSIELHNFNQRLFGPFMSSMWSGHDDSIECVRDITASVLELKEYLAEIEENNNVESEHLLTKTMSGKIFIIHGHDGEIKEAVARLLANQGIEPIILSEQANQGQTIIEKFERHAEAGAAIALFTKDDIGHAKNTTEGQPRARQNVVFEAGYFMGKFGRDRVILIAENGVEIPSDLQGVVYTDRDHWQIDVCKELKAMGYLIDLNKLIA